MSNWPFECALDGHLYRIWHDEDGEHFEYRRDGEKEWNPLPMTRTFAGWRNSYHGDWPPCDVVSMKRANDHLQIDYNDVIIYDERPLFTSWREASWIATFNGRRWDVPLPQRERAPHDADGDGEGAAAEADAAPGGGTGGEAGHGGAAAALTAAMPSMEPRPKSRT
jgi:hypothetical protein